MRLNPEALLSLLFALLGGWAVLEASKWSFSASLFPWLAGIPLFALSIVLLAFNLLNPTSSGGRALDFKFSENVEPAVARARALGIIAWLFGFALGIWILGFHIAIPVVMFLYLKVQGRETWLLSLSLAAVAYLFFWGIFDNLMKLPVPEPRLWIWIERVAS